MQEYFESVLLVLEIPKANDKLKNSLLEQLFASLHGILRDSAELKYSEGVQEHLSLKSLRWTVKFVFMFGCQKFYVILLKDKFILNIQLFKFIGSKRRLRFNKFQKSQSNLEITDLDLIEDDALPIKTFHLFTYVPFSS